MQEQDVDNHTPTKGERREARRNNERKMRVTGRSTLLLSELSRRLPKPRKGRRRGQVQRRLR